MTVAPRAPCFLTVMSSSLLLNSLRDYRQVRAAADKTPIYCVFGDTVMRAISQSPPASLDALQSIRGMTDEKCARYGSDILSIVRSCGGASFRPVAPAPASSVVLLKSYRGGERRAPYPTQRRPCPRPPAAPGEGIYILELAQGRVYVGRTSDMKRRIGQHMTGKGSAFSQAFPPTGILLPRLGQVRGSDEAAERDETLRYMFLRGIPLVRGWKYTRVGMSEQEHQDAEENIRELFDLCRRCGHPGHFVTRCQANFDRNGRPCAV